MNSHDILIIGAGGLAIQSLHLIKEKYKSPAFFDEFDKKKNSFYDYPLYHTEEIIRVCNGFIPLVADNKKRKELVDRFKNMGVTPDSLISPDFQNKFSMQKWKWNGIILDECLAEDGVKLGSNILINKRCSIYHNTNIGENVTLSPNVTILGDCQIDDDTFIGAGTIIREKVKIGRNCIIGMGSIVIEDIPDNSMAYGNPCRVIKENK